MKKTVKNPAAISLSLLLVVAVLLSGAHAKDVASASADHGQIHKTFGDDPSATVKVGLDLHLHNHVEKQGSSSLASFSGDQGVQADSRSLRMPTHKKATSKHWNASWLEDKWFLFRSVLGLS